MTIVTVAFGIIGIFRLHVETNVIEYFHPSAPFRQAVEIISERLQGTAPIDIIIEGSKAGDIEDPKLLKSIEKMQSSLGRHPAFGKSTSVVDYLKLINKAMHNNDQSHYVLPQTKEEVSQYLLVYSLADDQKTLDQYMDYDYRIARIRVRTGATSSSGVIELKDFIEQQAEGIFPPNIKWKVTGDQILSAESAQHLSHGILYSFSLAMIIISIIMMLLFRSVKMGAVAMIPNMLPIIFVLGVMGWGGIEFNIGTSIVVCVAIGIAVDDTIHFLVRYFYELKQTNHYLIRALTGVKITDGQKQAIWTTLDHVRRPITLTSVAIFLGFGVLGFSQFVPIEWFGILTALTMIFCLLCDLFILPVLLSSISI
jgi:predicted RND superfamily exporter protein